MNGWKIAAFSNDEIRGVGKSGLTNSNGEEYFMINCFGNNETGEDMHFQFYVPEADSIYNLFESFKIIPNTVLGDPDSLIILNYHAQIGVSKTFPPGWSWLSINFQQQDMSIQNILGNLYLREGDYIKNHSKSSMFFNNHGWFGSLETISPAESYRIYLGGPNEYKLAAYPAYPEDFPITVNIGWNWIGFPSRGPIDITSALSTLSPIEGDMISSQNNSSTFYDGYGWYGDLTTLYPLEGYILKSSHSATLIYPDTGQIPLAIQEQKFSQTGNQWQIDPADYQYTGQVTVIVNKDNYSLGSAGNVVLAYVGDELRGIALGQYFLPSSHWIYDVMIYSNDANGEQVRFKYCNNDNEIWLNYTEHVTFESDMIVGSARDPFELKDYSVSGRYHFDLE